MTGAVTRRRWTTPRGESARCSSNSIALRRCGAPTTTPAMRRPRRWPSGRRFSPKPGNCTRWPSKRRPPRPTPRVRMRRKNRSTRCWPARKFSIPSASSRVPGVRDCRRYSTGSIVMADAPILITGGAGFIGSNLAEALLAQGYSLRILDDLSSGKRSNLALDNPRVELIEGDVADAALVAQVMRGCQAVVHLAAVASVQASVEDPVRTHQSNFIGTLNVCEAMRQTGVKRVLFASSAAVYGNNGEGESIDKTPPRRR